MNVFTSAQPQPSVGWRLFVRARRWYNRHEGLAMLGLWSFFVFTLMAFYG